MKLGVALEAGIDPVTDDVLRALDEWAARSGAMPHLLPLWARPAAVAPLLPEAALFDGIRRRGVQPVVFAESGRTSYTELLGGAVDDCLRELAVRSGGAVVRWDQEVDGRWGAPWQTVASRRLYIEVFRHVSAVMRRAADVRMFYCPGGASEEFGKTAFARWFPGAVATQIIGFDRYTWQAGAQLPPDQWRGSIAECARVAPGLPVWVGETGIAVSVPERTKWLKAIPDADVAAVMAWDMAVASHDHDWSWSPSMYAAWPAVLART